MKPFLKVLGLMSGTSLDGLDIALVEIYETNKFHIKNTYFKTYSFNENFKEKVLKNMSPDTSKVDELCELNFEIGKLYTEKIHDFCNEFKIDITEIDLIGSHGQTFFHSVEPNKTLSTLQLGEPSYISVNTGITTVGDFRTFDVSSGGQGAPLVTFLDNLLFKNSEKDLALLNIGGISNFSLIQKNSENVIAFDTGPGNMILDSLIKIITNKKFTYDKDGVFSKKGNINQDLLNKMLLHNYFRLPLPKTTGREIFGEQYSLNLYQESQKMKISNEDLLATTNYFTAKTIYESFETYLDKFPDEVIISGGGSKNPTLLKNLNDLFCNKSKISIISDYGIDPEAKEAVAFAVLAYCCVFGKTNNIPSATGAKENIVMGKICPGKNYRNVLLKTKESSLKGKEVTETRNKLSEELDNLTTLEIVELMNLSDYDVLEAIENAKYQISEVMKNIIHSLSNEGKLFYIGAGTSGRLGVLDASECPPTFKASPDLVQGIIAGGNIALTNAVEGAEDIGDQGREDIKNKITSKDIIIGISANGKANYVIHGLEEAKNIGATTALITCNEIQKEHFIDNLIVLKVGPEVLSGSTRLKAGTATKMVLNMLTTGTFAKLGKVYGNYMVDLKVSNKKLKKRALNIIKSITNASEEESDNLLEKAEGSVKLALLMKLKNINKNKAKELLEKHKGFLRNALSEV